MTSNFSHSALTDSQENTAFSHLIDAIPSLVASIDCNMVVHYANKPFKKYFSEEGVDTKKAFPGIVGKKVFDQIRSHLGKVLVGSPVQFQISIHREKGFQYLDACLTPEFDEHKKVTGFIFYSTDVTEKLTTQRELSDYFENASIGLHWVNAEGIIIWTNPAELKMLGYSADEYIGHYISEFHVDKKVISDILNHLGKNDILKNYESELLCKDGSTRYVSINSSVLWVGDKFIHTRCFTIDITEQKLASKAVAESEERFRMMANLVPLVIWTTQENGGFDFLSVKFKEMTGKNMEDGLGEKWLAIVHPEDRENIGYSWMNSVSSQTVFEAKFRYLDSLGSYAVGYANASPRYDTAGRFVGYIGIFQDISNEEQIKSTLEIIVLQRTEILRRRNGALKSAENALKEKNFELERINKELSSFAHIASHDLQEPLRKIHTFSHRLQVVENERLSDQGKDLLDRIQASSTRMRQLINDLLEYSKTNDGGGIVESTDLNQVLDDVTNELELTIEEKNATIKNLGLPTLNVVKFQFRQLFLNLLSNALKFSKPSQPVDIVIKSETITAEGLPDFSGDNTKLYYHISLADNGIGFEPEFSEKIFEIFHRLHGRNEFQGTGIGLAICKKIVENHGGILTATGEVDKGATFHVYLPVTRAERSLEKTT